MNELDLDGACIIGAMTAWAGPSPFVRSPVVLMSMVGEIYKVKGYAAVAANVEWLSKDDWCSLLGLQEVMEFSKPFPAHFGVWFWLFRDNFCSGKEAAVRSLTESRRLACEPFSHTGKEIACLVIEDDLTKGMRQAWSVRCRRLCIESLDQKDLRLALEQAKTAYHCEITTTPQSIALMAFVCRQLGRSRRADGYVAMSKHYGEDFRWEVKMEIDSLTDQFA